jgi:hypothetical protein
MTLIIINSLAKTWLPLRSMMKAENIVRKNSSPLSNNEQTETDQWQSNGNQMPIKAILGIKNSGFPPLMINIYSDESSIEAKENNTRTTKIELCL